MKTKGNLEMLTLDQLKDKHVGKTGTPDRDKYEYASILKREPIRLLSSHQPPATSYQQPATSHQHPATSHQPPATNKSFINNC